MSKCDDTSPFFCSSLMPTSQKEIPAALHNLRTVWNRQCLYKKRRETESNHAYTKFKQNYNPNIAVGGIFNTRQSNLAIFKVGSERPER